MSQGEPAAVRALRQASLQALCRLSLLSWRPHLQVCKLPPRIHKALLPAPSFFRFGCKQSSQRRRTSCRCRPCWRRCGRALWTHVACVGQGGTSGSRACLSVDDSQILHAGAPAAAAGCAGGRAAGRGVCSGRVGAAQRRRQDRGRLPAASRGSAHPHLHQGAQFLCSIFVAMHGVCASRVL